MKYTAETKKYDPDHEDEASFDTWEEASAWLVDQKKYGLCNMWINNVPVRIENGVAVPDIHKPLDFSELLYGALKPPTREELERILRPVPTNPATTGEGA